MNEKAISPKTVYSTKETASLLGLGRDALRVRYKSGKLKAALMGNKYRFLGSDLLDYMKSLQPK